MDNKLQRKFVAEDLKVNSYEDIEPYFESLKNRNINSHKDIHQWLYDRSELESILSEDLAWRYIKMNCNTEDKSLADSFNYFVGTIEPEISKASNDLDIILNTPENLQKVNSSKFFTVIRELKKDVEIYRKENVAIEAELQQMEQEYGMIASKMAIDYNGEEITLQKAANYLKDTNRDVREEVYRLINTRRQQDVDHLNELLTKLIDLRQKMAENADFENFRDYKLKAMGRFDYTAEDCKAFHNAIAQVVKPVVDKNIENRKSKLAYDILKPWDLDVDVNLAEPLKPFETSDELIKKTIFCFRDLELEFGVYLNQMHKMGYLDLDSRKGKAPGGFNYPLHESNVPFIYMNATGNFRDVITMIHEGGHAMHAFYCADLEVVNFKDSPSEIAELASMTMELITMDYWGNFFDNAEELRRAKREHLVDVLSVLPWVATVDKFQHFLYENPNHTIEERMNTWLEITKEFGSDLIDYTGIESFKSAQWQKQLHIFEVPFYYIEYGIAQLGAIAIWKNFRADKETALNQYKDALKMGYTSPIAEVYKTAGIKFDFSKEYIQELMAFVQVELEQLMD